MDESDDIDEGDINNGNVNKGNVNKGDVNKGAVNSHGMDADVEDFGFVLIVNWNLLCGKCKTNATIVNI